MLSLRETTLIIAMAGVVLGNPMPPRREGDKGKNIVEPNVEDSHQQHSDSELFTHPGYENNLPYTHPNWNPFGQVGDSNVQPYYPSMDFQPFQSSNWNMHDYPNSQAGVSEDAQHSYEKYGAQQGGFDHHDQQAWQGKIHQQYGYEGQHDGSSSGIEHQAMSTKPKPTISRMAIDELLQNLFDPSDLYSGHSQKSGNVSEAEADEVDFHNFERNREDSTEGNDEDPDSNTTTERSTEGKEQDPNLSKRFKEAQNKRRFRKIWKEKGFTTSADPKDLAKQIILLRLDGYPNLSARIIGQQAAQMVKEEKLKKTKHPDQIYVSEYLQSMKYISVLISQRKERIKKDMDLYTDLEESSIESEAIREAFKLFDQREAKVQEPHPPTQSDKKLTPYRQRKKDYTEAHKALVAKTLLDRLHSKNLDISTIDPVLLAKETAELEVTDMEPADVKRYLKMYLKENGFDRTKINLVSSSSRITYAKRYSQKNRNHKAAS